MFMIVSVEVICLFLVYLLGCNFKCNVDVRTDESFSNEFVEAVSFKHLPYIIVYSRKNNLYVLLVAHGYEVPEIVYTC